jgi:hypothetical protein
VDFRRHLDHDELVHFIEDLNDKFSSEVGQPFYDDYNLPDKEDVNSYRKIYALTDFYINGKKFLEQIENIPLKRAEKLLREALSEKIVEQSTSCVPYKVHKKVESRHRFSTLWSLYKKIHDKLKKIKNQPQPDYQEIHRLSHEFFTKLFVEKYGIQTLKALVGEEGLFAMGEILGVNRSFSTLQDLQWEARVRFMARSWGELRHNMPIQSFVRNSRPIPYSMYLSPLVSPDAITGDLPTGMPENED